jgi:hydroxymethylpyrimidine pyrophosphatase-like HAD family hydrolase
MEQQQLLGACSTSTSTSSSLAAPHLSSCERAQRELSRAGVLFSHAREDASTIPRRIDDIRPLAEQLLAGRASLTTALTGMLEVLPLGASKGAGLRWLLEYLQVRWRGLAGAGGG